MDKPLFDPSRFRAVANNVQRARRFAVGARA
ncbi:hypothetical protein X566_19970 [Afipia sp. P52-10]|nr:hypothetical protein X566_19970 [Afipia sp. P52-10]